MYGQAKDQRARSYGCRVSYAKDAYENSAILSVTARNRLAKKVQTTRSVRC